MSVVGPKDSTQLRRVSWFCLFMCIGLMNGLVEVANLLKLEENGELYVQNQASWTTAKGPKRHVYAEQWEAAKGKEAKNPAATKTPSSHMDGWSGGNAIPGFGFRADGGPAWRDLVWAHPRRENVSDLTRPDFPGCRLHSFSDTRYASAGDVTFAADVRDSMHNTLTSLLRAGLLNVSMILDDTELMARLFLPHINGPFRFLSCNHTILLNAACRARSDLLMNLTDPKVCANPGAWFPVWEEAFGAYPIRNNTVDVDVVLRRSFAREIQNVLGARCSIPADPSAGNLTDDTCIDSSSRNMSCIGFELAKLAHESAVHCQVSCDPLMTRMGDTLMGRKWATGRVGPWRVMTYTGGGRSPYHSLRLQTGFDVRELVDLRVGWSGGPLWERDRLSGRLAARDQLLGSMQCSACKYYIGDKCINHLSLAGERRLKRWYDPNHNDAQEDAAAAAWRRANRRNYPDVNKVPRAWMNLETLMFARGAGPIANDNILAGKAECAIKGRRVFDAEVGERIESSGGVDVFFLEVVGGNGWLFVWYFVLGLGCAFVSVAANLASFFISRPWEQFLNDSAYARKIATFFSGCRRRWGFAGRCRSGGLGLMFPFRGRKSCGSGKDVESEEGVVVETRQEERHTNNGSSDADIAHSLWRLQKIDLIASTGHKLFYLIYFLLVYTTVFSEKCSLLPHYKLWPTVDVSYFPVRTFETWVRVHRWFTGIESAPGDGGAVGMGWAGCRCQIPRILEEVRDGKREMMRMEPGNFDFSHDPSASWIVTHIPPLFDAEKNPNKTYTQWVNSLNQSQFDPLYTVRVDRFEDHYEPCCRRDWLLEPQLALRGWMYMAPLVVGFFLNLYLSYLACYKPQKLRGFMVGLFSEKQRLKDWDFVSHVLGEKASAHLTLGITPQGMLGFLSHSDVGFLVRRQQEGCEYPIFGWEENRAFFDSAAGWAYNRDVYARDPQDAAWMDEVGEGPVEVEDGLGSLGLKNMLGYDLQRFIAKWLEENGFATKSVLEVIQTDPRFAHLRKEVGTASVFFSHIQAENFLTATAPALFELQNSGRLGVRSSGGEGVGKTSSPNSDGGGFVRQQVRQRDAAGDGAKSSDSSRVNNLGNERKAKDVHFFWLDYFALKQCQPDFDVHLVLGLIRKIGTVVAFIDPKLEYVKRSFCILESYAGCQNKLICHCTQEQSRELFETLPWTCEGEEWEKNRLIKSATAQTRWAAQKK